MSKKDKEDNLTDIQKIVNHYFHTKGYSLDEIKKDAKKKEIVYSRHTKPAKQLLELAENVKEAKEALTTVAEWAKSRNLDYSIETVLQKWLELDELEPKKKKKRPYYNDRPMVKSERDNKWYVIDKDGEWLEFAGKKEDIEWREED